MTDTAVDAPPKGARAALALGGLVAALMGVAILVWPTKTAVVVTAMVAIQAIIVGGAYFGYGIMAKGLGTGGRIGHALLGLLYVVAGIYAFTELERSTAFLAVFVVIMIGIMWIIEGFVALFTLDKAASKGLAIFFAILSLLAGATLVMSPLWGAVFLWWFIAISLIVLGVLNVFRALFNRTH